MVTPGQDYRTVLREEFESRTERNPNYSLRAFARDLGLSPSRLSEVLSHKTGLSRDVAADVADRIGLRGRFKEYFCDLVESVHARSAMKRKLAQIRLTKFQESPSWPSLHMDAFKAVADWYHFGILELALLEGFQSDPAWIADKLGLSKVTVQTAIDRLKRLHLLYEENGTLKPTSEFTATSTDVPSAALRTFHTQLMEKAIASLHSQAVEDRDVTSTLIAVAPADLAKAKLRIRKFRHSLGQELSKSPGKEALYCLGVQFFRLDQKEKP